MPFRPVKQEFLPLNDFEFMNYRHLVEDYVRQETNSHFKKKALLTTRHFSGDWFVSKTHRDRFFTALAESGLTLAKAKKQQVATLFLLTAENPLWQMVRKGMKSPEFMPNSKDIEGVSTEQYALFQVAKSVSSGERYPHLAEVSSESLIPISTFSTILRGLLLEKHGAILLGING